MNITPTQLHDFAELAFPEDWRSNRTIACIKAMQLLNDATIDMETRPPAAPKRKQKQRLQISDDVAALAAHLQNNKMHISTAARALDINQITLYAWFKGKSQPRPENLEKIRKFLGKD